jgi:plastocyanin
MPRSLSGWRLGLDLVASAVVASSLALAETPSPPGLVVVQMTSDRFAPATIQVTTGSTVVWRNGSNATHTVTADPSLAADASHVHLPAGVLPFNSGRIGPGHEYSHRFDVPGRYGYVCLPHEDRGMRGTVLVIAP